MTWIDVHTHLDKLEKSPEDSLQEAQAAGVARIITIGTSPEDHQQVYDIAKRLYPAVHCTLGVHPHDAASYTPEVGENMRQLSAADWVVAIGEIGLDYFYDSAPREIQIAAFRAQLELAAETGLPVEVHTREAEADTFALMTEYKGRVRGLLHCFTSSMDLAMKALDCGWNISFSGIITFKNAADLREVVKAVPIDRLHVETDAPFLTPVPFRGKKNAPVYVIHTAEKLAELKGISLEELAAQTRINALSMFKKLNWQ